VKEAVAALADEAVATERAAGVEIARGGGRGHGEEEERGLGGVGERVDGDRVGAMEVAMRVSCCAERGKEGRGKTRTHLRE